MPDPTPPMRVHSDELGARGEALARALDDLAATYARMGQLGRERDAAVQRADMKALAACVARESEAVRQVAEIDQRREQAAGWFKALYGVAPSDDVTATWIARRLPQPIQDRVLEAAAALRERVEAAQENNEASRRAMETLASHMRGVLHAASARMSHTGAYGRRGSVEPGAMVVSAVDLTS